MVKITKTAAKMYKEACKSENMNPDEHYLRVSLSNMIPTLEVTKTIHSEDKESESHGINIIIDPITVDYLGSATIDWNGTQFTIDAPNACGGCSGDLGCCSI